MYIAQVDDADGRAAARAEILGMRGWGLGKGHGERVHRVSDAHAHQRIAEPLGCLASGGYLAQVVRQDRAFACEQSCADVGIGTLH
jgi:hypothetical protein